MRKKADDFIELPAAQNLIKLYRKCYWNGYTAHKQQAVSSLQSNSKPSRRDDELVKFRTFLFWQRPFDADKPKSSFIVRRDVRIVPIGVQRR